MTIQSVISSLLGRDPQGITVGKQNWLLIDSWLYTLEIKMKSNDCAPLWPSSLFSGKWASDFAYAPKVI